MALTLDQALTGISGILVTPYDDKGDVAPDRLVPILDRALGAGLHMPVVNGNTGEFYALTTEEAAPMVREVVRLVDGRAPVLAVSTIAAHAAWFPSDGRRYTFCTVICREAVQRRSHDR